MAKSLYAHALIEGNDGKRYNRGDVVPADLEGIDELVDSGSVSSDEYVEESADAGADVSDGGSE